MRFKKSSELPGAESHMPTSPGAILLGKMAYPPKQIRRECISIYSKVASINTCRLEAHFAIYRLLMNLASI